MRLTTECTTFTRDLLGRYICNAFDEMIVLVDPSVPLLLACRDETIFGRAILLSLEAGPLVRCSLASLAPQHQPWRRHPHAGRRRKRRMTACLIGSCSNERN